MSGTEHDFRGTDNLHSFADDDVVITGISGRFPLADNLQELKDNLFSKANCITRAEERWSSDNPGFSDNRMGKLKNIENFDAEFFNINAAVAMMEDPVSRLLSEACYEAIVDSGYDPKELLGKDIGIFVGQSDPAPMSIFRTTEKFETAATVGYPSCFVANRLSYRCDVTGPSLALDTACSSSASAIEEAFRRMKAGSIEGAIIGAASLCLNPIQHKMYLDMGKLSPTAEISSYTEKANGFAVSDAVAIAFLQKKKDARRIYAKIHNIECITAVYQPEGTFAPSLEDMLNLYKRTYDAIGMDPSLVDYIEGNGSSTREADATEVNAIDEVFCKKRKTPLLLGTVKSNIGHAEHASALCSLAKTIIAFESGAIAPNIHNAVPNMLCPSLTDDKIKVVIEPTPYDRPLAAINSFGFGGTIAHLVLERNGTEYGGQQQRSILKIPKLIVYAATTKEALSRMFNYFQENSMSNEFFALLNKSSYISPFSAPYRGFTILEEDTRPLMSIEHLSPVKRQVWYILTGISCSQWLGMGSELLKIKPLAESLRRSAEVLEPFGIDLLSLLNPKKDSLQQDRQITSTLVTVAATQIAVVDMLNLLGLEPDGIIGHSTGEIVCSYADGCCTAVQAILLAFYIGESMETANLPMGAMAVVGLTWDEAKMKCPEGVFPACHDGEDYTTVSGSAKAVERFVEQLKRENIFASVINTSGFAFHSRNISEATSRIRSVIKTVFTSVQPRSKRWISSSYCGKECNEPRSKIADGDYFCHNLESEVHFREALSHIPSDAIIIEIGPHFLMPSITTNVVGNQASYIEIPERNGNSIVSLLSSIGKLYNLGLDPQAENLYEPVSYPVPRGTPMISPFIKWEHSKCFPFIKFEAEKRGQSVFFAKTSSSEKFLLDHCIEGRSLYPAAGYVYLAWNCLAKALNKQMESLPVCIENLKILRATLLSANDETTFFVRKLDKSGGFEIIEGGSVVATGKIYSPKTITFDDSNHHYEPSESSIVVSGSEIYSELKIHGYEYGPAFQGLLEVSLEGVHGLVKWNDEWISFLDSLFLFFGVIHENHDFKLPTGILSIKIDPNIHMDFVKGMKAKGITGIPVKYDKIIRKCTTPGVEIRDLKLSPAPHRSTSHDFPVLEEYSFVPYNENHALFGREKTEKCESYVQVCNYLAKQIVLKMNITGKIKNIFDDVKFNGNIENQECLFAQEDDSLLLKSLRNILEMSLSPKQAINVEKECQKISISDVLVEDVLFKCMLSEKPLRSILDVALENLMGKMNIAEWCDSKPLLLTAVQEITRSLTMTKNSYFLVHSHTAAVDIETLREKGIQVESAVASDVIPSDLNGSCHLVATYCMAESGKSLKSHIRSIASLTKKGGFILVIHKHRLTPAELLMCTLSKLSFTLHSEAEIENLFQEEMLKVVSKKSSSFGMNTYLLRKVPEKPHPPEVYVVKVLDAEYDKWVEDLKKAMSTVQEEGNSGVVLLVAQDTVTNGTIGLVNCLRQEPGGDKIRCILTDSSTPPFDLNNSFYTNALEKDLLMNVYINGTWGSFRHSTISAVFQFDASMLQVPTRRTYVVAGEFLEHESQKEYGSYFKEHSKKHTDIPQELSDCACIKCTKPGDLSSLQWLESSFKNITVGEENKELYHVYYSSLNFRDVMLATGKISDASVESNFNKVAESGLGFEFSGRDKNGRRVMAAISGGSICNTYLRKPVCVMDVPDNWTLEEAATVPVVYNTCYYALIIRGELQHGESILIHSGTGGIGQAAIRIAQSMDCEIFVTVGTLEKKDFLMKMFPHLKPENIGCSRNTTFEEMIMQQTEGEGVDVILNSLADDKFQASVRCLGDDGRFLEIGKYDLQMDNALGLEIFLKGISFHGCQMDTYFERNKKSMDLFAALKVLMEDGIRSGVVQPLNTTVFPKEDVEKAFRYMGSGKHTGKVLIQIREEEPVKDVIPCPLMVNANRNFSLYSHKSYIIIGGLGGFGIELAKWLVQKGAGAVILTSRYGARTPYHHLCLKRWESSGARVFVSTLNVCKQDEAQRLLEETSAVHGPIGGIFNSAVILKDAFIENQTASAFEDVCAPKVLATKHMDEISRLMCPELDLFVCFSSISCGKGNAGQTNYGYANSVMERICEKRKQDGLHGMSIQWGIIGDVGLVHRQMGDDAMIAGVMGQKVKSCLQCLEKFLLQDKAVVSSYVIAEKSRMKEMKGSTEDILTQLARIFGVTDIEEMNPYRTFGEMGMDSMGSVEIRQLLQSSSDVTLPLHELQDMKVGDIKKLLEEQKKKKRSPAQIVQKVKFSGLPPSLVRHAAVAMNKGTNGVPVFVIHGNDFLHEKHLRLYQRISQPVFALQINQDTPITTLKDMSLWFLNQIQKICPYGPIHLMSVSSSGNLALAMILQSEKSKDQHPHIISLTVLDGSIDLMQIHSTTEQEKIKNAAAYEASDLCSFLSGFSDSDLTELKKQLEETKTLEDRISMISSLLSPSQKSSFAAAAAFHVRKQTLMRFEIPKGKIVMGITAIEDAEKVLPNDVSPVKSFLKQICDGNVTIHRTPGNDNFLVNDPSASEVATLLNELYKTK